MKLIKNKEKLNGFEIHNFFVDGYTFHNNFKERFNAQQKNKGLKEVSNGGVRYKKDYYSYD